LKLTLSQEDSGGVIAIGELARESGVPASTIRYWEQVGVLPRALRVSRQRRYRRQESLERLAVLRLAQLCGFRLEEMRGLVNGFREDGRPSRRWRELAGRKRAEIDRQMARLRAMRRVVERVMACECPDWAACGRIAEAVLKGGDA
jgi:MerR family transcriptional regulator, redox-sensitive transcriptional activator SoxR